MCDYTNMKTCRKCNLTQPLINFVKRKNCINGLGSTCKKCYNISVKQHKKAWRDKQKHLWCVYYLPEEHYVGITSNIKARMQLHDYYGIIIVDYEIIIKDLTTKKEAIYYENILHKLNYYGKRGYKIIRKVSSNTK